MSEKKSKRSIPAHAGGGRPLTSRPTGPGTAFANFLIDYLPHLDLTNEAIADKLGYARPNIISMWKRASTRVTVDAIWKLSELLRVDLAYLLTLYFEQFASDNAGGADHFPQLVELMSRVTTPEEWEIIRTVREARKQHSFPLKGEQKKALKALFAVNTVSEEGPLKELEFEFATSGDRRTFSRRGQPRDMSIDEIEEAASRKAESKSGKTLAAGKRAKADA